MSLKMKLLAPFLLLAAVLVFSGCGEKQPVPLPEDPKVTKTETEAETLPLATGKADDVAKEVIEEALVEQNNFLEEENDAGEVLDDSEETNDFGGAYNENEF